MSKAEAVPRPSIVDDMESTLPWSGIIDLIETSNCSKMGSVHYSRHATHHLSLFIKFTLFLDSSYMPRLPSNQSIASHQPFNFSPLVSRGTYTSPFAFANRFIHPSNISSPRSVTSKVQVSLSYLVFCCSAQVSCMCVLIASSASGLPSVARNILGIDDTIQLSVRLQA